MTPGVTPRMTPRMTRLLLVLLPLALLAGCGRAGPPKVPGPKEEVIYPKRLSALRAAAQGRPGHRDGASLRTALGGLPAGCEVFETPLR